MTSFARSQKIHRAAKEHAEEKYSGLNDGVVRQDPSGYGGCWTPTPNANTVIFDGMADLD
jgi:hypothetical protein